MVCGLPTAFFSHHLVSNFQIRRGNRFLRQGQMMMEVSYIGEND